MTAATVHEPRISEASLAEAGPPEPRVIETRRFTAAELDRMVEVGIIDEDEPVELIEGALELMSPQSEEHAWLIDVLAHELRERYEPGAFVRDQKPLPLGEGTRPEPDIAVLRGPLSGYRGRRPSAADAILVVEIAVSSLERDHKKARIYAGAGVPVLWIVDVEGRRLEVHTEPTPEGYSVVTLLADSREVSLPEREGRLKVASFLP